MSAIFANDLPYSTPTESPFESLKDTLAFSPDDWGDSRAMAWVYGIILGWDDEVLTELAQQFRWSAAAIERLRVLHAAFEEAGE
jgi:hypothetical protein